MQMTYRKTKTPGKCPVRYCRNLPRNIGDHTSSCQLCGSHAKELWRIRHPEHAAYDSIRASARKRGIVFTLTLAHFKATIAPTAYLTESGNTRYCLHIDRKDNTLGYIDGNIQVMTCAENVAKGNAERRQKFVDEKIRGRVVEYSSDPF